jgi:hypothetical protein
MMKLSQAERGELETILGIVINQIPNYFNLINSSKEDWDIKSVNDCVFGMVFNSFVAKSTQYLKDTVIDDESKKESDLEIFETVMDFFNEMVPKVKSAIVS